MVFILRLAAIFSLTLLVSCAVSLPHNDQVKHLQPLPNVNRSVNVLMEKNAFFSKGNWPEIQWWHEYASSDLDDLMQHALFNNPSIQAVRSRIQAAKQETIVVGSALFPLVYFNGKDNLLRTSQNGLYRVFNPTFPLSAYLIDMSLSFNYEFDFWNQNHNLLYASIGQERVQEAEAAEVILITTTSLAQAYFAYKTNLMREALYSELVVLRKNKRDLSVLLLNKGLNSALTPYLATERVGDAEKLLASIQEEIAVDAHLINILAGRNPATPIHIHSHLSTLPPRLTIPAHVSIDLLARRPDLMAQIWRAKALAFKTGANMADFYPNVNLIGLIGLESTGWKKLLEASSRTANLRPAINLPIFTAGAIRANINVSKAQFDEAIATYNNLLLQSTQDVLDRLAFAQSIYQQKQAQTGIVLMATQRYDLTHLRGQKGLDSQFDDYDLQEEVIQNKLVDVMLLYQQYVASIRLIKALGGGYCVARVPLVNEQQNALGLQHEKHG